MVRGWFQGKQRQVQRGSTDLGWGRGPERDSAVDRPTDGRTEFTEPLSEGISRGSNTRAETRRRTNRKGWKSAPGLSGRRPDAGPGGAWGPALNSWPASD